MMDINSQEQNLLGSKIFPKSEDFCILAAIANQMMDIISQHHNLLGNQISPISEDFRILAAILD